MEDENLLEHFEVTGAWIENALSEIQAGKDGRKSGDGGVFVHW